LFLIFYYHFFCRLFGAHGAGFFVVVFCGVQKVSWKVSVQFLTF